MRPTLGRTKPSSLFLLLVCVVFPVACGGGGSPGEGTGGQGAASGGAVTTSGSEASGGSETTSSSEASGGNGDDDDFVGTPEEVVTECIAACLNYNTSCGMRVDSCEDACNDSTDRAPRGCDLISARFFNCLSENPATCTEAVWDLSEEVECGSNTRSRCIQTKGEDCGRQEPWDIQCAGGFAHVCQVGVPVPDTCTPHSTLYEERDLLCCTEVLP